MRTLPMLLVLAITGLSWAAAPPALAPPKLRLGDGVRPTRYAAELTVDPTKESFSGKIDIDVVAREATPVLWLNADEITVTRAEAVAGSVRIAARPQAQPKDFVGLAFDKPLPAGASRVHIEYTGKLASKETSGAARQKEGDEWYVFTHFEPIDARRVFPCFDEPSFKVPWRLSLVVRASDRAFGNTPETARRELPGGLQRVEFAESKPLPSYLVAWAVGPFETVDAGKSRSGVPIRIITPKGMASQARYAAESTKEVLGALEDYFGTPYPYEKLDHIAVPFFGGAMENPGLITYSSSLMLRKPADETIPWRRSYAGVATHELAHQWFGDLVTMAWWDDLWLNEAFASWMTPKIIEKWQPTWGAPEGRVRARSGAMGADSLVSARQIRQPIISNDDIKNAFDGITYGKGASVLHMFEQWIGAPVFQKGVRRYLKTHAFGNATAADFLSAISAEAGRDIAPAFSTFLDQPGVPLVSMELACDSGRKPVVRLRQERYLPEGSPGDDRKPTWKIPVCVRYGEGTKSARACTTLTGSDGELPLDSCPAWLLPNEGSAAYYRSAISADHTDKLLAGGGAKLTVPERIGVLGDLRALVDAGKLPYDRVLAMVPGLANDPNRHVVQALIGLVAHARDADLVPDALRPAFARMVRNLWQKRARALGWLAKKSDDEDTRILRTSLVPLVADEGEDAALQAEAKKLAAAWLADRASVDPDIVGVTLDVTAINADQKQFDTWLAAAKKERDQTDRRRLLGALSGFRDPAIAKQAIELTFGDAFDIRESMRLLWGATGWPATRPLAWRVVQDRFDALVARMPRDNGAYLPFIAVSLCDDAVRTDVERFFKDRASKFTGGPRELAQALEAMRLCAVHKRSQGPAVARFLQKSR